MGQSPVQKLTRAEKLKHILEELEHIDEKTLNLLYAMMDQHADERKTVQEDPVIDHTIDGTPIREKAFFEAADKGVAEVMNGSGTSADDFFNKKDEWLKNTK